MRKGGTAGTEREDTLRSVRSQFNHRPWQAAKPVSTALRVFAASELQQRTPALATSAERKLLSRSASSRGVR